MNKLSFKWEFEEFARACHNLAKINGWCDGQRNLPEFIALCHSELSEALEGLRHGNPPDDKIPEFSSVEAELADVIIRIAHVADEQKWRLAEAIIAKLEYNKSREYRHGGKAF